MIGVDFDNTIVCYDGVFHRAAVERGLIPPELPVSKGQVRDHLRRLGQEHAWTELQGEVYVPLKHRPLYCTLILLFHNPVIESHLTYCPESFSLSTYEGKHFVGPAVIEHRWIESCGREYHMTRLGELQILFCIFDRFTHANHSIHSR